MVGVMVVGQGSKHTRAAGNGSHWCVLLLSFEVVRSNTTTQEPSPNPLTWLA